MGGGASVDSGRFDSATKNLKRFCGRLQVSDADLKKIFAKFEEVDKDRSGEIGLDEFFDLFKLDFSKFGQQCFSTMDVSGDHRIVFDEFVVGLYNYCTLDRAALVKFSFDLFDVDGSGEIDHLELKSLCAMVHGSKGADETVQKLLKKYDKDRSGKVEFAEFVKMEKATPSLLRPAFDLQQGMVKACFGSKFWEKATAVRKQTCRGQDLIEMQYELTHEGKKLDRSAERAANAGTVREGYVKFDGMTRSSCIPVFEEASEESARVDKVKAMAAIDIEDQVLEGGEVWFKLEPDRDGNTGWVQAKYIKIDHTWLKAEKRAEAVAAAVDEAAKESVHEEHRKAAVKAQWVASTDKATGDAFWFNLSSAKVTKLNPFVGEHALWRKECLRGKTHEEFMSTVIDPLDGAVKPASAGVEPPKSPRP